jgi:hypothetical protein
VTVGAGVIVAMSDGVGIAVGVGLATTCRPAERWAARRGPDTARPYTATSSMTPEKCWWPFREPIMTRFVVREMGPDRRRDATSEPFT